VTPERLPVLIVGDVHGDLERLFSALKPYPADSWQTIFLGDLVDVGPFGVGALRYARDRPNSTVLLGNHEVAMIWALRDRSRVSSWLSIGGQPHDLEELARDPDLQAWLRDRPALLKLPDGTLIQHSDTDLYQKLLEGSEGDVVAAINREARDRLLTEREEELWFILSPYRGFRQSPERLRRWLRRTGSVRLVHGHSGHRSSGPESYHGGLALNFDGGFSRFGSARFRRAAPFAATVSPLPPAPALLP
jgi:hypothetical protein